MPPKPKSSALSQQLRACLEQIKPSAGYYSAIQRVYGPSDRVPDKAPLPYLLFRPDGDTRTSTAGYQATRVRTFVIEAVFPKSAPDEALDEIHIDLLRALGFGEYLPERKFPGLLDDEDGAQFEFASQGAATNTLSLRIGVTYVETYN